MTSTPSHSLAHGASRTTVIPAENSNANIPGGYKNHALGIGSLAAGFGNEALDFQTVVGHYNLSPPYSQQLNNLETASPDSVGNIGDKATFVVGNGTSAAHRHNGFTVSDKGAATAYDSVISGAPTTIGTVYANNTIVAWGNVGAGAAPTFTGIGCTVLPTITPGIYLITLNVHDPNGLPHFWTAGNAAIVASVSQGLTGAPGLITVQPVTAAGNFFITTYPAGVTPLPSNAFGFQFHVVAR